MVKKRKNKKILPLWVLIPIFLFGWYLFFISSIALFSFIINLINFPTGFTLFIFPIVCAFWFMTLLISLFFANQINIKLKELKIIKK